MILLIDRVKKISELEGKVDRLVLKMFDDDTYKEKYTSLIINCRDYLRRFKEWEEKRKEVFGVHGEKCILCDKTEDIQVHHLVYKKAHLPWEYDAKTELIPLCKECHQRVHDRKNHPFHEKYLP